MKARSSLMVHVRACARRFPPTGQPKLERTLQELVQPDCTTRELSFAERQLGPEATVAVAVMLAHNISLRRLDFRRNRPELRGLQVGSRDIPTHISCAGLDRVSRAGFNGPLVLGSIG